MALKANTEGTNLESGAMVGPSAWGSTVRPFKPLDAQSVPLMHRLRTAIWVFDIDRARVVHANAAALQIWQSESEEELCARDFSIGMTPTVKRRLVQYQRDLSERNCTFNEAWTLYPNGKPTTLTVVFNGFRLPDGRMALLCEVPGADTDNVPDNVRSAEALLLTDVMITLYADDGEPLYMNPPARQAAPHGANRFRNSFVDPEDHDDILQSVVECDEIRRVARIETARGPSWHDLSVKRCTDAVTGKPALLVTAVDVSELKTARDQARYLADCDQLTGCFNRAYFSRVLDTLVHGHNRNGYALVFIDLDHFKQINDGFGHDFGDRVLCLTAERLLSELGEDEHLARFGGDEFVALVRITDGAESLERRIDGLRQVVSQSLTHQSTRIEIKSSIGAAALLCPAAGSDDYMRQADTALYHAKNAGRNRYAIFNEHMRDTVLERYQIEQDLEVALREDQFVLFYQPRVDAVTETVVSVEALVRWMHPDRGLVPPSEFIAVCEETGMIEELGYIVLRKGCAQLVDWHERGFKVGMSINVSPRQFLDDGLMDVVRELAELPGLPVGSVEFEITESVLIGDRKLIARRLTEITDIGFRIAIDDFGTGYSNLAFISRFPLDCIKIDKSFVDELPETQPVIRLIQTLATQIGASTVAEGVEQPEQVEQLRKVGCSQLQGYYFSKPVAPEKLFDTFAPIHTTA